MRVFVTGASGTVGRRLCEALVARGDRVVALSRSRHTDEEAPLRWVQGSYDNIGPWQDAVDGCSAVVNLAGEPIGVRWNDARLRSIIGSRVGITAAVMHAIAHAKSRPKVLINASAVGVYGTDPEEAFDEEAPVGAGFVAGVCREWEKAARKCEDLDVRVVRLRIGVVLAREGGALPKLAGPVRMFVGGALGHGGQWVSWIHIDDVVAMILAALDDEQWQGAVNAVAPNPVRQRSLVRAVAKALRRPAWLDAPAFAVRMGLGRMAVELLLHGQKVIPARAQALGFEFRYPELQEAVDAELGAGT